MLGTRIWVGRPLCFENSCCKHYCIVKEYNEKQKQLVIEFEDGVTAPTEYTDPYLRELRPMEEVWFEMGKIFNKVN